uniref:Uncharacterized protein n=1 Tax=Octactis speculum TaxID=3111310 RepID=A0A6U3S082_9STRA|mmetsp:Transcript_27120/g.37212  ORF Transcript_27120/g.37212 Transcript_27120/m.37212 type:complete len:104 (+) Transcript_27120:1661-1972(+)
MKTQDIRDFMKTLQDLITNSGGSSPEGEPSRAPIQEQPETEPEEGREGRREVSSITLRNEILILGGGFHHVEEIALQWGKSNKQGLRVNWAPLDKEPWVTSFI